MPEANDERQRALERAAKALARRDHSTNGLREKLQRAGVSEPAQEAAVEALAGAGYLNDERFARDRAEHLAARGYGDEWIRADLDAQGLSAEGSEAALSGLEPERNRALRAVDELGGGVRAVRTLQRRGFSEDTLESVLPGPVAETP